MEENASPWPGKAEKLEIAPPVYSLQPVAELGKELWRQRMVQRRGRLEGSTFHIKGIYPEMRVGAYLVYLVPRSRERVGFARCVDIDEGTGVNTYQMHFTREEADDPFSEQRTMPDIVLQGEERKRRKQGLPEPLTLTALTAHESEMRRNRLKATQAYTGRVGREDHHKSRAMRAHNGAEHAADLAARTQSAERSYTQGNKQRPDRLTPFNPRLAEIIHRLRKDGRIT